MKREALWITLAALLAVGAGVALGMGISLEPLFIGLIFILPFAWVGKTMASERDRSWLPLVVPLAYGAKLVGSLARYLVLQLVYNGIGDAVGYHGAGIRGAPVWRSFQVPVIVEAPGSIGTKLMDQLTGLIYAPYTPDMLGGFFLFATLAFIGQLFLYAALRDAIPDKRLKLFGVVSLFLPTMLFWPSSIGKDAIMILCIGAATYGMSRLLVRFRLITALLTLLPLALATAIRTHMGALLVGAFVVTVLIGQRRKAGAGKPPRRLWAVILALGLLGVALWAMGSRYNLDLSEESVDSFVEDRAQQTAQGGSEAEGASAVASPKDIPGAFVRVLFQPLIYEAGSAQEMVSAIEGTILLVIVLWRSPTLIRNLPRLRKKPMLLLSAIYVFGFIIAFSTILNQGILARQRSQAMVFFIAWLIGAGLDPLEPDEETAAPAVPEALGAGNH